MTSIRPLPPSTGASTLASAVARPGTFGTLACSCQPERNCTVAAPLETFSVGSVGSTTGWSASWPAANQPPTAAADTTSRPVIAASGRGKNDLP